MHVLPRSTGAVEEVRSSPIKRVSFLDVRRQERRNKCSWLFDTATGLASERVSSSRIQYICTLQGFTIFLWFFYNWLRSKIPLSHHLSFIRSISSSRAFPPQAETLNSLPGENWFFSYSSLLSSRAWNTPPDALPCINAGRDRGSELAQLVMGIHTANIPPRAITRQAFFGGGGVKN